MNAVKCKCGSELFTRNYLARGVWRQLVRSNHSGGVDVDDSNLDGLRSVKEPKYMKCCDCGTRVLNPDFK